MASGASAERGVREWTAPVNGTGLRVEEVGAGHPAVVFSPALFTNRAMFDAPVAALSSDHRCIRYDHRGQGDSGLGAPQPSQRALGTEGLYEDAVALLDLLGVDSCHWVGASIGGFVGIRLAARHPERIRSLVLIGLSTRPLSLAARRQVALFGWLVRVSAPLGPVGSAVRQRAAGQVMRNMLGTTFMSDPARAADREEWRQRFLATVVPEAMPMLHEVFGHPGNPPELLARVHVPTLIISGQDELAGLDEAENDALQAQRVISGSRFLTIPGAGHMVLVEQPVAGTAAIAEFIRQVDV